MTTDPASGVSKKEGDKIEGEVEELILDISNIKDHTVKNKFCLLAIRQNVSDTQFDHVAECNWAYTAWKILEGVHKGKGGSYLMGLYRSFFSYRKADDESIDTVASSLTRIQTKIGNASKENKPTDFHKDVSTSRDLYK